jgi:uncharacterized damage-inducible protein DinB
MDPSDALTLLGYHYWANGIVLRTAAQVSPAEFAAAVTPDPGHGSLRGTLVHLLGSETRWLRVLTGEAPSPDLDERAFADAATLSNRWDAQREKWLAYCTGLGHEALNASYTYQFNNGPVRTRQVWQTIMHVVNHGTQHRSEAAAMLTGYGRSPGDLTFNYYVHLQSEGSS